MTNSLGAENRTLAVDGLSLSHLDWGNAGAPPLVCVHGFRGNAHAFDGLAARFSGRFHIIALDVRGRSDVLSESQAKRAKSIDISQEGDK